jgi:hypothetical protein
VIALGGKPRADMAADARASPDHQTNRFHVFPFAFFPPDLTRGSREDKPRPCARARQIAGSLSG